MEAERDKDVLTMEDIFQRYPILMVKAEEIIASEKVNEKIKDMIRVLRDDLLDDCGIQMPWDEQKAFVNAKKLILEKLHIILFI